MKNVQKTPKTKKPDHKLPGLGSDKQIEVPIDSYRMPRRGKPLSFNGDPYGNKEIKDKDGISKMYKTAGLKKAIVS